MTTDSFKIASDSLRANILTLPSGKYLTAGQHQFLTLWTRDFCHAVRGLLALNEDEVVMNHLGLLLKSLREDGLVPRVVDNKMVQLRVAWQAGRKLLPFLPSMKIEEPLKPQYTDEHGSCAIDSNLLVLIAALQMKARPQGEAWWKEHDAELKKVYHYYDAKIRHGFIYQTPFADWQDSVSREGYSFLTNFFYFIVSVRLRKLGWNIALDEIAYAEKLKHEFFVKTSGVFKTMRGSDIVSIDGNLLALEADEFLTPEEKKHLWYSLKQHLVVLRAHGHLGMCSHPDYRNKDLALHVKFARLHGYHGHLAWSWLMGLGLKVAYLMNDEETATKQKVLIDRLLHRDGEVLEIYCPEDGWKGWESWLVRSERPFAWGSGYLVEALSLTKQFR